jgi:pimeloyl-ACP methyl ester carboxylesterase
MELTDFSRTDSFPPNYQPRKLMISAFFPSVASSRCKTNLQPYMPSTTASFEDETYSQNYGLPNQTFSHLELSLCEPRPHKAAEILATAPLILLSPGLGNSRFFYSFLAQSIASTVDHPQDADIVEFADGSFTLAANITDEAQINVALKTRVTDVSFVLDSLSNRSTTTHLFKTPSGSLNTSHAAIFGHSLGGATALSAMLNDSRFVAGANLDGTFFGKAALQQHNTPKPFLIFGHEGKNQSTDPSWKTVWPRLRGWKLELELEGTQHGTFEDWPVLIEALGFAQLPADSPLREVIGQLVGTIDGTRAVRIMSETLVGFFDFALKNMSESGVRKALKTFQEIKVVAKGGGA